MKNAGGAIDWDSLSNEFAYKPSQFSATSATLQERGIAPSVRVQQAAPTAMKCVPPQQSLLQQNQQQQVIQQQRHNQQLLQQQRQPPSVEEPVQNKRARDTTSGNGVVPGDRLHLLETENAAWLKKQKTMHEDQARIDAQASALQSRREDLLSFLSDSVKTQQAVIASLHREHSLLISQHRAELTDTDAQHCKSMEALRAEIGVLKQRITDADARDTKLREELATLNKQLAEAATSRASLEQQLAEARQAGPRAAEPVVAAAVDEVVVEKERAKRPVATLVRKRDAPVVDDESLYSWRAVKEASARCGELYGFSAQQLIDMHALLPAAPNKRHRRGPKQKHDNRHHLLMLLYYLGHYPTMQVLGELFSESKTSTAKIMALMLEAPSEALFDASVSDVAPPVANYLHGAYFLPVQVPVDVRLADTLWCEEQHGHGLWAHAVHDAVSGKALDYCVLNSETVDAEWLAHYVPNAPGGDATRRYEARMRGKFALTESRYRGTLEECDRVVRTLLALTNLDLQYDNAVHAIVSNDESADDEVVEAVAEEENADTASF
jgi:hypothetical protein